MFTVAEQVDGELNATVRSSLMMWVLAENVMFTLLLHDPDGVYMRVEDESSSVMCARKPYGCHLECVSVVSQDLVPKGGHVVDEHSLAVLHRLKDYLGEDLRAVDHADGLCILGALYRLVAGGIEVVEVYLNIFLLVSDNGHYLTDEIQSVLCAVDVVLDWVSISIVLDPLSNGGKCGVGDEDSHLRELDTVVGDIVFDAGNSCSDHCSVTFRWARSGSS